MAVKKLLFCVFICATVFLQEAALAQSGGSAKTPCPYCRQSTSSSPQARPLSPGATLYSSGAQGNTSSYGAGNTQGTPSRTPGYPGGVPYRGNNTVPEAADDSSAYITSTKPPEDENKGPHILAQNTFSMYFLRTSRNKPEEATLRLSSNVSLSGCLQMTLPKIKMEDNETSLLFTVTNAEVEVKKNVRYAHFEGNAGMNFAAVDIVLNRDDLLKNQVTKIGFRTENSATEYYDVDVNNERLALLPRSPKNFKAFPIAGRTDSLVNWFYPENTVVLFTPTAPPTAALDAQIRALAAKHELTPLTEAFPDFAPPSKQVNTLYFVDEKGRLHNRRLELDRPEPFDVVSSQYAFHGPQGTYQNAVNVPVFIRVPGSLE